MLSGLKCLNEMFEVEVNVATKGRVTPTAREVPYYQSLCLFNFFHS